MFESFYGLIANPFRLSADEGFRFVHPSYKKAWSYLKYALQQAEGFVLVTGRPGTGKTTLIRDIVSEIDSSMLTVVNLITNQFQSEELLRMVALELGFEAQDYNKAMLLTRLSDHATQLNAEGRRIVIIVDEAQNLTENGLEELRLISNLQIGNQSLFQIFLLGQEELRSLINRPGMANVKQRIIASCRIELLDEKQTREYIEHRLDLAGWESDPEISEPLFPLIQKLTHGIPREINHAVGRLLLYGALEEKHKLNEDDFWAVVKELNRERRLGIDIEDQLEAYREQQESNARNRDDGETTEESSDKFAADAAKEAEDDIAELAASNHAQSDKQSTSLKFEEEMLFTDDEPTHEVIDETESAGRSEQSKNDETDRIERETGASFDQACLPESSFEITNDASSELSVNDVMEDDQRGHERLDLPEIHIEGQGEVAEQVKSRLLTDVDDLFGNKFKRFSWRWLFYPLVLAGLGWIIFQPDSDTLLSQSQKILTDLKEKASVEKLEEKPIPEVSTKAVERVEKNSNPAVAEVSSGEKVEEPRPATTDSVKPTKTEKESTAQSVSKPIKPEPSPEIKQKQLIFLFFADDQENLTPQSQMQLATAVQSLNQNPSTTLKLTGVTGSEGAPVKRMRDALNHALLVADELKQQGISSKRIFIEGIQPDGWENDGMDFHRSESSLDRKLVIMEFIDPLP